MSQLSAPEGELKNLWGAPHPLNVGPKIHQLMREGPKTTGSRGVAVAREERGCLLAILGGAISTKVPPVITIASSSRLQPSSELQPCRVPRRAAAAAAAAGSCPGQQHVALTHCRRVHAVGCAAAGARRGPHSAAAAGAAQRPPAEVRHRGAASLPRLLGLRPRVLCR